MPRKRDVDADDRFFDQCLDEELGGRRPPDLAQQIAAASAARLDLAAATVDEAARMRLWQHRRTTLLAAAGLLIAATLAWAFARTSTIPSAIDQEQALIDEFHRVMPMYPAALRDADRRAEFAPAAVPVIRAILAYEAGAAAPGVFGTRILEFEVYAAVLGDRELLADLQRRAANGDARSAAVLAVATAATTDGDTRADALARLAEPLRQHPELESSVARALATAELSVPEAHQLAASFGDAAVRRHLVAATQAAATGPRHLLGQRLELSGRLVDDRQFDTASLRGRPVLVVFWASWCRPCQPVLEEVQRLHTRHPELAVVAISCDSESAALTRNIAEHRDRDWIHVFDRTRPGWHELAGMHGVGVVPFVMLLDRDGIVRDVDLRGDLARAVDRVLRR